MCAVEQPVSVRTPSRLAPSESTYWTGSRASCGTVNGCTSRSPTEKPRCESIRLNGHCAASAPVSRRAANVPCVSHTGIPKRLANGNTPSPWSACSCVTTIPERSEGARPTRARRDTVSRSENPQSSMRHVRATSTTSALPRLPLPSEAKRTKPLRLFQLLLQQGENPTCRLGGIQAALLVEDLHFARVVAILHEYAILLGLRIGRGAPEHELGKKTVVLLVERVGLRIDVAHEVETLRAIAVLDGEAYAIEHESHAPPGPVERLGELESPDPVLNRHDLRPSIVLVHRKLRSRTRVLRTEADHQPAQKLGLYARVRWPGLPHRAVAVLVDIDLGHAPVGDIDLGGVGLCAALQTRAEFVALAGGVGSVENAADQVSNRILFDLCAIFGPVGLHDPGFGDLGFDHEAESLPEILDDGPDLFGRLRHDQPALAAGSIDPHFVDFRQDRGRSGPRCAAALGVVGRKSRRPGRAPFRDLIALVTSRRGQVGRNLERRELLLGLVIDLRGIEQRAAAGKRQPQHCRDDGAAVPRHPAFPSTTRRPLAGVTSAWRMASLTTSWNCCESGVSGRRMPMPISPICATAHFTGIGLASTKSFVWSPRSLKFNSRAFSRSPASAAEHISCISRGATLAVTEMIPLPPRSMSASPLASSPL